MKPEQSACALLAASEWLDQPAILGPDQDWTWRQVHQAALSLAPALGHASVVCILCNSRLNFLVAWLAALRSGVCVVLPPSGGHADLAGVLNSTPHPLIVADAPGEIQPSWRDSAECLVCPPVGAAAAASVGDLAWQPEWDRTAVRLYTSGSTGAPVAHAKTLRQLFAGAQALGDWLAGELDGGLGAVRRIVCSVPPQHMFGIEASVMLSLVHGIAVEAARPLLPADVQQAFAEAPATAWVATPIHLRTLVRSATALSHCSLVLTSTMPLSQELARQTEALAGAPVLEIYGSTETGVLAMRRSARDAAWRPVGGARVEPAGDTALAFGRHFDSPVRLPDEIEFESGGSFRLLGRSSDMIKIGGRRASLAGLNLLLADLPGLEDGVFYLPITARATDRLCLIYSGPALERVEAERWLRSRLDPAFLPRAFIHVDRLPRNENGKLPRQALDDLFAQWQRRAGRAPGSA